MDVSRTSANDKLLQSPLPSQLQQRRSTGFLRSEQHWPASLLRTLLLMAGIESNPGPKVWICRVCSKKINKTDFSVKCIQCIKWSHLTNCSSKINNKFFCKSCQPTKKQITLTNQQKCLNILQFNCNGVSNKKAEIEQFVKKHEIHIAAIQESKLNPQSKDPFFENYTTVRKDRMGGGGGGLLFLVHQSINFSSIDIQLEEPTEVQAITLSANHTTITIINIYIPPESSCPSAFKPNLTKILAIPDVIILGDFNAHDSLWHSNLQTVRGELIANQIDNSPCGTLNLNTPTRLPSNGQASSPDISIVSDTIIVTAEWTTKTALSSDHLPIQIQLQSEFEMIKSAKIIFNNFNKANWSNYKSETEQAFNKTIFPNNVNAAEKLFRNTIINASKHSIPRGRRVKSKPGLSTEICQLMDERDNLRAKNPTSEQLKSINSNIQSLINNERSKRWKNFVNSLNPHINSNRLWQTIKNLSGKPIQPANSAISFNNKQHINGAKIADEFNKLFTCFTPHKTDKQNRKTTKLTKKLTLTDNVQLSNKTVAEAIKASNSSKATGPDGLTIFHLKHLGPAGLDFLTKMFNVSISQCTIPDIYKKSKIIPLLKPGKPVDDAKSYRPISLLSPVIKVLEKCLLPFLNTHLQPAVNQHGFRPGHSTTTALTTLTNDIASGLNNKRPAHRTVLVALDLSKAFDMVNHRLLINDVLQTTLPDALKRWLSNYLHGRQAFTEFRNNNSKQRLIKSGVPQGSILSPTLFNFYVSKAPQPPANIKMISYADDFSIYTAGSNLELLATSLNAYLPSLTNFFTARNLQVSPQKSSTTLFTSHTAQYNYHPQIIINNSILPLEHNPKILGLTLDTMFTFTPHHKASAAKCSKRNNVLKALTGIDWGQNKETIISTYKAIGRPVLEYASPAWASFTAPSNFNRLQLTQNAALRIATGCHTMASLAHIHHECKMLPVQKHVDLLASQFLLQSHLPTHPCHQLTTQPNPSRLMKPSLRDRYEDTVDGLIPMDINNVSISMAIKTFHTTTVQQHLESYYPPVLLNGWPPPGPGQPPPVISNSEQQLSRQMRRTLAQLRSGHCILLNNYKARIDSQVEDKCPNCDSSPHNVIHIFNCPNKPTNLSPIDLWRNPVKVAEWINQPNRT